MLSPELLSLEFEATHLLRKNEMSKSSVPRGVTSTILMSILFSPFGGFLWIGRGKLAVLALIVLVLGAGFLSYFAIPAFNGHLGLLAIPLAVLAILVVLPFRNRALPLKWYSHGLYVVLLAGVFPQLTAFGIRSFLYEPFSIPSTSMEPNLVEGDHFWVSKFAYGYSRFSFPFALSAFEGRVFGKPPERGDVVVFRLPSRPDVNYVSRVVGMPGESVQMIDGVLHIDGMPAKLEDEHKAYISDAGKISGGRGTLQREMLSSGVSYLVTNISNNAIGDNTLKIEIPNDHYFMISDNRDNSNDSRFEIGLVPFENLIGRAERIYWNSRGQDYSTRSPIAPKLSSTIIEEQTQG